jgi:hypothetical protein
VVGSWFGSLEVSIGLSTFRLLEEPSEVGQLPNYLSASRVMVYNMLWSSGVFNIIIRNGPLTRVHNSRREYHVMRVS